MRPLDLINQDSLDQMWDTIVRLRTDNARLVGELEACKTSIQLLETGKYGRNELHASLQLHQSALKEALSSLELCGDSLKHESIFLEDYLKVTTHPGVSRLVGDNHEAFEAAKQACAAINKVLCDTP